MTKEARQTAMGLDNTLDIKYQWPVSVNPDGLSDAVTTNT